MTYEEFIASLDDQNPPPGFAPLLRSLWYDGKGDWDMSHQIAQDIPSKQGAHIHAYLHRKEGDLWNADYWYRRAGKTRPMCSLEEEWDALVKRQLGEHLLR